MDDDDDQMLHDDPALNEDKNEDDILLRERGLRPGELSASERNDLVDDARGDSIDDDDRLSGVVPPEENDNA